MPLPPLDSYPAPPTFPLQRSTHIIYPLVVITQPYLLPWDLFLFQTPTHSLKKDDYCHQTIKGLDVLHTNHTRDIVPYPKAFNRLVVSGYTLLN